jgi:Ni/Fe-hydrogenase subunit HybB-like protein
MSARHLKHALKLPLVISLGRILLVALIFYGVLRVQDLVGRDALKYAFEPGYEASLFLAEVSLAFVLPILLLLFRRIRESARGLYLVAILVVFGFMMNRLNVSITGMEGAAGLRYLPKWTEVAVTFSIVAAGVALFALAVRYLPIFSPEETSPHHRAAAPSGS